MQLKRYTKICPICATVNKDLYLEETNGWMECEKCHNIVKVIEFEKMVRIPVYSTYALTKYLEKVVGAGAAK